MRQKKSIDLQKRKSYDEFLRSVQLHAMGLNRLSVDLDRAEFARLQRESDGGRLTLNANYLLDEIGKTHVEVRGVFKLLVEDAKTGKSALSIEAEYGAHLHAAPPIERKLAEQFTQSELRIILWPFFRQCVFDMTGRMGIFPITLPIAVTYGE